MPHFVDDLKAEAEARIAAMRETARAARFAHARAELMRHMLLAGAKTAAKPRAEAIEFILREWTAAWHLDREAWPHLAHEMEALTGAFVDYARNPGANEDAALRDGAARLEAALAARNSSIADEMAFRSQCAHRWWEMVTPTPADLPGRKDRPTIPTADPTKPFWETGCAEFCKG
jgi:hypothetical protein